MSVKLTGIKTGCCIGVERDKTIYVGPLEKYEGNKLTMSKYIKLDRRGWERKLFPEALSLDITEEDSVLLGKDLIWSTGGEKEIASMLKELDYGFSYKKALKNLSLGSGKFSIEIGKKIPYVGLIIATSIVGEIKKRGVIGSIKSYGKAFIKGHYTFIDRYFHGGEDKVEMLLAAWPPYAAMALYYSSIGDQIPGTITPDQLKGLIYLFFPFAMNAVGCGGKFAKEITEEKKSEEYIKQSICPIRHQEG